MGTEWVLKSGEGSWQELRPPATLQEEGEGKCPSFLSSVSSPIGAPFQLPSLAEAMGKAFSIPASEWTRVEKGSGTAEDA